MNLLFISPIFYNSRKFPDNGLAFWGQHAFGMELDAMNFIVLVLQPHNATIITYSRNIQTIRETHFYLRPMNDICLFLYA